jgi:hypothetical protein
MFVRKLFFSLDSSTECTRIHSAVAVGRSETPLCVVCGPTKTGHHCNYLSKKKERDVLGQTPDSDRRNGATRLDRGEPFVAVPLRFATIPSSVWRAVSREQSASRRSCGLAMHDHESPAHVYKGVRHIFLIRKVLVRYDERRPARSRLVAWRRSRQEQGQQV